MSDITIKVESGGQWSGIAPRISINNKEIGYEKYSRGLNVAVIDPSNGQPVAAHLIRHLGFRGEWAIVGFKGPFQSKAIENLNNQGSGWGSAPISVKFWIPSQVPVSEKAMLGPIKAVTIKNKLQPNELQRSDYFGYSVSISGNWAIVGAYYADAAGSKYDAGAAYMFQFQNGVWQQK